MLKALRESTLKQRESRLKKNKDHQLLELKKPCGACEVKAKDKKNRKRKNSFKSAARKELGTSSKISYPEEESELEWDNQEDTGSPLKEEFDFDDISLASLGRKRSVSVSLNRVNIVEEVVSVKPVTQNLEEDFDFEEEPSDNASGLINQDTLLERNLQLQGRLILDQIGEQSEDSSHEEVFDSEVGNTGAEMNQVDSEMLKSINALYIKASADIDAYTEDDCSYLDKDKFHEYVDKASNKCTEFRFKVYEFVEDIEDNGLV